VLGACPKQNSLSFHPLHGFGGLIRRGGDTRRVDGTEVGVLKEASEVIIRAFGDARQQKAASFRGGAVIESQIRVSYYDDVTYRE